MCVEQRCWPDAVLQDTPFPSPMHLQTSSTRNHRHMVGNEEGQLDDDEVGAEVGPCLTLGTCHLFMSIAARLLRITRS